MVDISPHRNKETKNKETQIQTIKVQRYINTKVQRYRDTDNKDTKTQRKRINDKNCLRRQFSHHTDIT